MDEKIKWIYLSDRYISATKKCKKRHMILRKTIGYKMQKRLRQKS